MPMLPWLVGNCQALSTAFLIDVVVFFLDLQGLWDPGPTRTIALHGWRKLIYHAALSRERERERERERASETSIHVFQNHRMLTMKTSSQGPAASRTRCKRRRTQLP